MKHNDKYFKENRSKAEELFEMIDSSLACRGDFYSAHLWNNHSSRITDDILRRRIISEKKRCTSAFNISDEDVVKRVYAAIEEDKEFILDWLADDSDGVDYEIIIENGEEGIGRMFLSNKSHNWEDGAIVCDSICIVLTKTNNKKLFKIKTAYPYSSEIYMPTAQEFGY